MDKYISILIPAYNCSKSIYTLLESIPYRDDIEIVIANDASLDNTIEVLKNYRGPHQLKILNFKINHGVGFIRNKLIDYSSGHWICWADSDDSFNKNNLDTLFNDLYNLEKYNWINILAKQSNGVIRSNGCEPWKNLVKRDVYKLIKYPEIRSAEDWYFKKYLEEWYPNYKKPYTYHQIIYYYNKHPGSLYQLKKKSVQEKDFETFNYLENPDIIYNYSEPLDIVVLYLDSRDTKWQEQFNYWKNYEIEHHIQEKSNAQAFGVERTREWSESFRYWYRGIERACPWVRYIHLICFSEDQVPEWLDTTNPKIKVHYHREFIPEEYLPTFNPIFIYSWLDNIKNLSNYFIIADDDYFFLNYIPKTEFFNKENVFGECTVSKSLRFKGWGQWGKILNNSLDYANNVLGIAKKVCYNTCHLPTIWIKSTVKEIVKDERILKANSSSKFRSFKNVLIGYVQYLYLIETGKMKKSNTLYKNSKFTNLDINTNFDNYRNCQMACFNDSDKIKTDQEYKIIYKRMMEFFRSILPNKSQFEK